MTIKLSIDEIQRLGFEWPRYPLLEELAVIEADKVDLRKTIDRLLTDHAYYQQQINEAYQFKQNTGTDYSDFTDRFDDYVKLKHEAATAMKYLNEIIGEAE